MHVLRAEKGDTGKEIGLRSYFSLREKLSDWTNVFASLKKINAISMGYYIDEYKYNNEWGVVDSLWAVLETYPNKYCHYPLYVFLHKYGTFDAVNGFALDEELVTDLILLIEEVVRYYFIKGVVYNSVNAVKDTTFKACAKIANEGDYLAEYRLGVATSDKAEMSARLDSNKLGKYQNGLILLASYLNPEQDKMAFADFIWGEKYDIEHILPKKWNNYDGWTETTWKARLNTLGNLIPLEKKINISASNSFLKRKKAKYGKSKVQDALDIAATVSDNGWTPKKVDAATREKMIRLNGFFGLE
jgi:hypothetical protein